MRSLPLLLLLLSSCLMVRAQSNQAHPYMPELLEVAMDGKQIADTVDVLKNGAAIYPNSKNYVLRFSKNPSFDFGKGYFLTVLDVQPNGVVNQLYPNPIRADEYIEVNNDSPLELQIDSRSLQFKPPYGKEQFLVLFSERPLVYYNLSAYVNDPDARVLQRHEVDWIMAGAPPQDLEGELLIFPLIFELRPDGSLLKESNVNAEFPFDWEEVEENEPDDMEGESDQDADGVDDFFLPDSAQVIDRYLVSNADLYSLFPILTFIQPIEPSYENGVRGLRVHSVSHSGPLFSITGTLSCSKKMDRVEFVVESMDERSGNSRTYTLNQFRTTPMALLFSQQVNLFQGRNRITVTAFNALGFGVRQELFVQHDPVEEVKGSDHLLVLAINEYEQWNPLENAVNDADSIIAVLQRDYGIQEAHTHRLINSACTKKAIDSIFRILIRDLDASDRLVVYFAGHGYFDTLINEGYWIPVDARKHDWNTDSYLPNSTISKYISSLPTRHSLFISDACFSGSYCLSDSRGVQSYLDRMDHARSRWVFSSGRMEQVADDYQGSGHSPFAYYILKYLRNPEQKAFTTSELAAFVTRSVSNNSEQTPMARPVRNAGDEGGEYVFIKRD